MPGTELDDDLVMALVEENLLTPPEEREARLRQVCPDERVYEEVRGRVYWEERMGRFLLDPLFERTAPDDPFAPGNLVLGRFRILRKVGYGGMGIVFEAVDEKLDRRVALKCARPGHRYRLPPEARAAREVSHYNVCKVHDLHSVPGDAPDIEFLSMEFIDGQTLSERIASSGPVPEPEARQIARQICAGLAHAHRQGVIHGDLKCSNILLARARDGGVRAVITDFGMAKMEGASAGSMMSGRGGTFDYMAPELLLGERATVRSDLYALGVLFHIMLKGRSPERESTPPRRPPPSDWRPDTLASTLTMGSVIVPSDWRRKIDDLPSPWNHVVDGCLTARPADRFVSTEEVEAALQPRSSRLRWAALPAAAAALLFGYWQWMAGAPESPVRLAVLPFTAEGSAVRAAAGIALDVADRLNGSRRSFTVMPPRDAQANQVNSAAKAKSILGATHVLQARLRGSTASLMMEASIDDLASGRTIGSVRGTYAAGDAPAVAKAILATVTRAFQLRVAPRESLAGAAYVPYVQAMDLLRQSSSNAAAAVPLLQQAIQLDPRSALPYAGLAEAQIQRSLGGDGSQWLDAAAGSIAQAKSLNSDSPKVLLASGFFEQQHGRYEQAIREFTRAAQLDPGNADAWRRLAGVYESTNRDDDAVATYRKSIELQPGDSRPYLTFGNFYFFRNQFQKAEEQYRKVTALAPGLPDGYMDVGLALIREGRLEEAEKSLQTALQIRSSPRLLMNLGGLKYLQERYDEAARLFEQSLATGSKSVVQYRDLGDAYRQLGRVAESQTAYRAGLDLALETVKRNPRDALSRARLGLFAAFLGDAARAEFEMSQALAMQPENPSILREAATAYETLGQRDKTLAVLSRAPLPTLEELSRFPDVRDLQRDPRFAELLQRQQIK